MQHQNDWYTQCGMNGYPKLSKTCNLWLRHSWNIHLFRKLEVVCVLMFDVQLFWFLERRLKTDVCFTCFFLQICFLKSVALALLLEAGHLSRLQQWDDRANLCNASGFEYGLLGYSPRCTVFEISPIRIWTCWDDTNLDPNPKQSRIGRIDSFLQVCNQQSKK